MIWIILARTIAIAAGFTGMLVLFSNHLAAALLLWSIAICLIVIVR
jgi:hypothetical protein